MISAARARRGASTIPPAAASPALTCRRLNVNSAIDLSPSSRFA
jgi:hypothetical protein